MFLASNIRLVPFCCFLASFAIRERKNYTHLSARLWEINTELCGLLPDLVSRVSHLTAPWGECRESFSSLAPGGGKIRVPGREVVYSPEPLAEVYCVRLNFNTPQLVYCVVFTNSQRTKLYSF